jgi:hypothetical protein
MQGHRWAFTFFFLGSGIGACDGTEPSVQERPGTVMPVELRPRAEGAALECRWQDDTASLSAAASRAALCM